MRFAEPKMLWLLAATLPALLLFFFWSWRKRTSLIQQFVQSRLLAVLTVGVSASRLKLKLACLSAAVTLLFVTLARPQWGFKLEEVKQRGLDVLVAIDTSRSMLATDIRPNRLARAKLAALDLLRLAKNDRLGLIAFAGSAFLQCPLTLDEDAFRQSLQALEVGIIPQGGTALTEAIQAARDAFKKEGDNFRVLVLITDGEDHEEGALEAAKTAAKDGIKIFTIGVGSAAGELMPQSDESGHAGFVKDDSGNIVKTRLNELLLQEISTASGAFYLPLQATRTMQTLYEKGLAPLPKAEFSVTLSRRYYERFQWPLAFAIGFLALEILLPEHQRRKRRATPPASALLALAAAIVSLMPAPAQAQGAASKALRHYQQGNYATARKEYEALAKERPNDSRLLFNAGAAAYRDHNYENAAENFRAAALAEDVQLQQSAYYNLGNSLFQAGEQAGEPDEKSKQWELAAKQYETALKLNAQDSDARNNLQFVRQKLEELKKQQQQQKKDQKSDDKDKKDDQKDQDSKSDSQKQDQKQQDKDSKDQQKQDDSKKSEQKDQKQNSQEKQDQKQNSEKQDKPQQEPGKDPKESKDQNAKQDPAQKDQKGADGSQSPEKPEPGKEPQDAASGVKGQMTPQQAMRLLDTSKAEEKALLFQAPRKSNARIFKDW